MHRDTKITGMLVSGTREAHHDKSAKEDLTRMRVTHEGVSLHKGI